MNNLMAGITHVPLARKATKFPGSLMMNIIQNHPSVLI